MKSVHSWRLRHEINVNWPHFDVIIVDFEHNIQDVFFPANI